MGSVITSTSTSTTRTAEVERNRRAACRRCSQSETRPELVGREELRVDGRPHVEEPCASERADDDGLEASVPHEARCDAQSLFVVRSDRDGDALPGAVRLALQALVVDRVEGANEADAG